MRATDAIGAYGERVAERYLVERGMEVLDRNWRCELGELDLVARDGDVLVFCEVKTRSSLVFGAPLEAVTAAKARRMRRVAARWLDQHAVRAPDIRFDVVGVMRQARGPASVEHVRGLA